jgi:hypothetical protein
MSTMTAILDEYEEEVSGEAILSGSREVKVYVPENWTGEYVAYRLKESFETLRRAFVGRIGPKGAAGYWPEVLHDADDIRGWATDHRHQVESAMARARSQPGAADLARMDESLSWPMQHLQDKPLEADAVTLWAYTAAWGLDAGVFLKYRRERALPLATAIAARLNAERLISIRTEKTALEEWARKEFRKRNSARKTSVDRAEAVDKINAQAFKRFDRFLRHHPEIKPSMRLAIPDKIVDVKTLETAKGAGLELLADRLYAARVPVR